MAGARKRNTRAHKGQAGDARALPPARPPVGSRSGRAAAAARAGARGGARALQKARSRRGARGGARGNSNCWRVSAAASGSAAQRQLPLRSCAAAGRPERWHRVVGSGRAVGPLARCRVSLAGEKRQCLPLALGEAQLDAVLPLRRWVPSVRIAARGAVGSSGAVVGQRRGARAPRALLSKRAAWAGDLSLSGAILRLSISVSYYNRREIVFGDGGNRREA